MKKAILIFGLLISSLSLSLGNAWAEAPGAFKVTTIDKAAWVTRADNNVKASLKKGDVVYEGDVVEVFPGNSVELGFIEDPKNKILIPGGSKVKIMSQIADELELINGKVFALLDDLEEGHTFKIMSSTAVAAVRGTRFQVKADGLNTTIYVYSGEVRAYFRGADGEASQEFTELVSGQKTSFIVPLEELPEAVPMDAEEKSEIMSILPVLENRSLVSKPQAPEPSPSPVPQEEEEEDLVEVETYVEY